MTSIQQITGWRGQAIAVVRSAKGLVPWALDWRDLVLEPPAAGGILLKHRHAPEPGASKWFSSDAFRALRDADPACSFLRSLNGEDRLGGPPTVGALTLPRSGVVVPARNGKLTEEAASRIVGACP